jgi:ribose transport system permease protein
MVEPARVKQIFVRFGPFLGLLLVTALFALLAPDKFLSSYNLRTVAMQATSVALGALGMTFVVVTGGIDLSIGAVVALVAVASAACARDGLPIGLVCALGVLLGSFCGLVNGALVTRLSVVPFIVTLGTMGIARGAAKWLANDQKIDAEPGFLSDLVRNVPEPAWLGVGPAVWVVLVVALLLGFVLRRTVFGVHAIATGSNEQAAALSGVDVRRTKLLAYVLCGACAGLCGLLQFGLLRSGVPSAAMGLELQVVAAVVIGGASLSGGQGSLLGALLGALMMQVLKNGCTLTKVPDHVQDVLIGVIIIGAVAIDRWRSR